jgi:metallophosphoesterase superfamily enzyme
MANPQFRLNTQEQAIIKLIRENPGLLEPVQDHFTDKAEAEIPIKPVYVNPYDPERILIIGDLHEPFCLSGYMDHCITVQKKHDCGTVIFIGDIIDNHFSSYHETDPDGYSAGEELDRAINRVQNWYQAFPEAKVIIGNHDRIVTRKAFSGGLSKRWVRDYSEVLQTPGWEFLEEYSMYNISFNHGEGGTARNRIKNELQSQVQGHLHSQAYIEYIVGKNYKVFGMQVGAGIDAKAYAMAYGKHFKKPIISCGVIVNQGNLPILEPMEL